MADPRVEKLAQVLVHYSLELQPGQVMRLNAPAIAAEPKPVHVPRERPPVVQVDEGPLVLVETKRDLRNLQLPF